MQFADKVAVVTGGSGGIGKACCLELARQGATVLVNYYRNEDEASALVKQICKNGGKASAIQGDNASVPAMQDLAEYIGETFGKVNFLVNNAGIIRDNLLLEMPEEDWDEVIRVNLKSVFATTKALLPLLFIERGAIVNVSSISASIGSKGHVNYAASKGGLEAFTRALAIELAPKRIRVNAVAPGYVITRMSDEVRQIVDPKTQIPLRRFGEAEEIAQVIAFLLSNAASYITGEVIKVAGGIQ
jgi:3-oxoacyl-[acyl-carrier protein] reductase